MIEARVGELSLLQTPVDNQMIAEAQRMREARDRLYGNIFHERATDQRWVGDLGEIVFDRWLTNSRVPHDWANDDRAAPGNWDFAIGATTIGVKTVKRKVPIRADYTAQITARHANEAEHVFFLCYQEPARIIWLLGGATMQHYLDHATYYGAGAKVHANYTVRAGHEIYNGPIRCLTSPATWLRAVATGT